MNPQAEDWIKVCTIAKQSWVDESTAALCVASRPLSAQSTDVASAVVSAIGDASSAAVASLRSLTTAHIEQRIAIGAATKSSVGAKQPQGAASGQCSNPNEVLELVLDNMALRDCGECDGATSSPLTSFPNLRRLTLNFNAIASISTRASLQLLQNLRVLELDFNKLVTFGPLTAPYLEVLSVNNNLLVALNGLSLPRLHTLQLSHNRLGKQFVDSVVAQLTAPALTHLDVSHNSLSTLDGWSQVLSRLSYLNVSHNAVASLNGLQSCNALQELDASHNRLRYVPLLEHTNALRPLGKTLCQLDVSHNDISSLGFFPSGAMVNVWSLSLAANAFHRKKLVAEQNAGRPAGGSGVVLRGAKGTNSKSIFEDDVGDAAYGEDDAPRSAASSTRKAKPSDISSNASMTRRTSQRLGTPPPLEMSTNRRSSATSEGEAATFLARLAKLFPAVEVLDLSDNGEDVIGDIAELKSLSRCAELTELKLRGTIAVPAGQQRQAASRLTETVRTLLPQVEVLDGEVLVVRQPTTMDVEDLEAVGVTDPKTLFRMTRPGSARPGSAASVLRPGTSQGQKTNALHAAKLHDELHEFEQQMQAFLARAEISRKKVDVIIDHMNANAAWAYGDGKEPPPLELAELDVCADFSSARRAEADGDCIASSSSDDDDTAENTRRDRLVVTPPASSGGQRRNPQPPGKSIAHETSVTKGSGASPKTKTLSAANSDVSSGQLRRSASVTTRTAAQGTPLTQRSSESRSSQSSSTATTRAASVVTVSRNSVLYDESEAMKRVKAQPTSNFRLEQARFKKELDKEARERREQLEALTRDRGVLPAPKSKKLWLASAAPKNTGGPTLQIEDVKSSTSGRGSAVECGTSMVSPARLSSRPVAPSAAVTAEGSRVTTSTATSPQKTTSVDTLVDTVAPRHDITDDSSSTKPSVPRLALGISAVRGGVENDGDITLPQEDPPLREKSTVVADPRDARKLVSGATEDASRSPIEVPGTQRELDSASVASSSRPTSAAVSSTRRPHDAAGVPKVRIGKGAAASDNPLIKLSASSSMRVSATPAPSQSSAKPPVAEFSDDGGEQDVTYFSTRPVDPFAVSAKPIAGGSSLNRRRLT